MTNHDAQNAGGPRDANAPEVPPAFEALRQDTVRLLTQWTAPEPHLESLRQELLRAAERPGVTWREGGGVHFTAGLVVLDADLENVALTLHRKAKRWFQFGGHLESCDRTVREGAQREGHEESGIGHFIAVSELIQVDAHDLPGVFGRCRTHLDLRFAARCAPEAELRISDESDDVRWWPVDALPAGTDPSLHEAVMLARTALSGSCRAGSCRAGSCRAGSDG